MIVGEGIAQGIASIRVRPGLQQEGSHAGRAGQLLLRRFRVVDHARKGGFIGPGRHEMLHGEQDGVAIPVGFTRVCAHFQQPLDDSRSIAAESRQRKRCISSLVLNVDAGAPIEEKIADLLPPAIGGPAQGGEAIAILIVEIGAVVDQQLHQLKISVASSVA